MVSQEWVGALWAGGSMMRSRRRMGSWPTANSRKAADAEPPLLPPRSQKIFSASRWWTGGPRRSCALEEDRLLYESVVTVSGETLYSEFAVEKMSVPDLMAA